jgi:hypothetical protein
MPASCTTQHETHTVNTVQSTANDLSRVDMGSGRSLFQCLPMKHFPIDTFHCAARSESLQCAVRFPVIAYRTAVNPSENGGNSNLSSKTQEVTAM